jgi:hypothetical protein
MKITGHKTSSMFKRYADLFSDEEQWAQQHALQNRSARVEEGANRNRSHHTNTDSRSVEPTLPAH